MIIIGYPGIGKSTLAVQHLGYIDLESSNFKVDGIKIEGWQEIYCNILNDCKLSFIKWEDDEPWAVSDLLNLEVIDNE